MAKIKRELVVRIFITLKINVIKLFWKAERKRRGKKGGKKDVIKERNKNKKNNSSFMFGTVLK